MRRLLIVVLALFTVSVAFAGRKSDRKATFKSSDNYEVVAMGIGTEGTKYVKAWAFGNKVDVAIVAAKKAAVAAAIFKGIPGNGSQVMATPALCRDANAGEVHAAYFDKFFSVGGPYLRFVNATSDGVPSGQDRLKVKGGYKVGVKVQVMYENLRKQLEKDGIIKKLNHGF